MSKLFRFDEESEKPTNNIKRNAIPSIKEMLHSALEEEKKVDNHRTEDGYLSISSISGGCLRKDYYRLKGYEANNSYEFNTQWIFGFGHAIHDYVQNILIKYGHLHGVEQFMKDDELKICGSTDGFLFSKSDKENSIIVNDFKTCNLSTFTYVKSSNKAKKDHIAQLHLYGYLLNKTFDYKIDGLKVTYINKNQAYYFPYIASVKNNLKLVQASLTKMSNYYTSKGKISTADSIDDKFNLLENSLLTLEREAEKMADRTEDWMIQEVDFDYSEDVLNNQVNVIKDFWTRLENNKPPNKTTKKYICSTCEFYNVCYAKKEKIV